MSQQSNTSDGTIFTMMPSSSQFDPLSGLHGHHLEQDLELQVSCLSDDELIELLKNTEDPAELAYLNMELSRQTLPDGRGSILSFESRYSGEESLPTSVIGLSE